MALVGSVGAGMAFEATNHGPSHLTTIEGKVVQVETNPHWNVAVDFKLKAINGTVYNVELGPPWFSASEHLPTIHVGDMVKVEGVFHIGNDLDAFTISVNGGRTFTIRDGFMAEWAESRSGETRSDNDTVST